MLSDARSTPLRCLFSHPLNDSNFAACESRAQRGRSPRDSDECEYILPGRETTRPDLPDAMLLHEPHRQCSRLLASLQVAMPMPRVRKKNTSSAVAAPRK